MTRALADLVLALSASAALGQDYNRPDLERGLCQKDGCDEFTILAADRLRTTEEGTLFKTRVQTFHASHGGRQERAQEDGYVFCSPTKPAIMAEQNGQTMAFFLAPFATQESRESVRQNANFHALYFAICHGREAGRAAVHNLAGVAQSQGYRVALARSKLIPLNRAEDVVTTVGDAGGRTPASGRSQQRDEARLSQTRPDERRELPVEVRRTGGQGIPSAETPPQDGPAHFARRPRAHVSAREDEGLLLGARRMTNRAFDALGGMADWVVGRGR